MSQRISVRENISRPCSDAGTLDVRKTTAVVLAAAAAETVVNIHGPACLPAQRFAIAPGKRLLVVAGHASLRISGADHCHSFDTKPLSRLLAFLDHSRRSARRGAANRQEALCLHVDEAIEQGDISHGWFVQGLFEHRPDAARLAAMLADGEAYRLVRFILDQEGSETIAAMAQRYGLSEAQFRRSSKQVLGRPLKQEMRLIRASNSLMNYSGRAQNFTQVAVDSGYASPSHFCSDIRALLGVSPRKLYQSVMS